MVHDHSNTYEHIHLLDLVGINDATNCSGASTRVHFLECYRAAWTGQAWEYPTSGAAPCPPGGLGWELTTFFTSRRHGCSTLSHHYTGSYAGAHLLPYSRGRLSFMFMCSQAIMVCSFSPLSYAQGECSLMRRNCNCNSRSVTLPKTLSNCFLLLLPLLMSMPIATC